YRAVGRFGQRARQEELAAIARGVRKPQVLLAKLASPLEVVVDEVVEQQEVRHQSPSLRTASIAAFRARRFSRRSFASRCRRCNSSVSATIGGTGRGLLSSSSATNTRYALDECTLRFFTKFSASTRTPTSIDVRPTSLTIARTVTTSPM